MYKIKNGRSNVQINPEVLFFMILWDTKLKGLAMIFDGQENPFIIFRSKEIYM